MERLRVETGGKRLDAFDGERMTADLVGFADPDVLEEFHGCSAAGRRPNMGFTTKLTTGLSDAPTSSKRNLTKPISGRLREVRLSSTLARSATRSPGRRGASHLTSS